MKILILGVSGMLGNAMLKVLVKKDNWEVFGTLRNERYVEFFPRSISGSIISNIDTSKTDVVEKLFNEVKPNVVINCIGITKHQPGCCDPALAIEINSLLPHRLANICMNSNARLIHISTDCVFSGNKGNYIEADFPDANDLYGRSKALGEVTAPDSLTLRTSIIGHELDGKTSLIEWFLAQKQFCSGYSRAIFSGLPTTTLAEIVRDFIIPDSQLSGLYHVGAAPITKFDLLKLIAQVYDKSIEIKGDDHLIIDRSLNCERFYRATGYIAPKWPELIKNMYDCKGWGNYV
jgi:dTDP-4-dehydrorhamnose reductase